ncbi:hypothetical protein GGI07_004469 [Coemansia sp. Benny D115]|nr:hypothetical protein GGI07_004469 [Coemansia sp. Benny D115]
MTDSDACADFDLFGETTADDQQQLKQLNQQRLSQAQQHLSQVTASPDSLLAYQRRRYLWSDKQQVTEIIDTLKARQPINFGQVFTAAECQAILDATYSHAAIQGWTKQRHGAFPTRDIPIKSLTVSEIVYERLSKMLFPKLMEHTGISANFWTFRDLFVVGYHEDHQRSLKLHTDGCLASLTLLLNNPSEFEGGGTYFEKFKTTVKQEPGDAWVHDANLSHSGVEISSGKRIIMVAFMDTVGGISDKITY